MEAQLSEKMMEVVSSLKYLEKKFSKDGRLQEEMKMRVDEN